MKDVENQFMIRVEHKLIILMLGCKEDKNRVVKSQNYEKVAQLRDLERTLIKVYEKIFNKNLCGCNLSASSIDLSITRQAELIKLMKDDNNILTKEERIQLKITLIKILIDFRDCMLNRKEDNTINVVREMLITDPDMTIVKELAVDYPDVDWNDIAKNKDGDFERIIRQLKIQLVLDN